MFTEMKPLLLLVLWQFCKKKDEPPREYFHRLKTAYFQRCYAPGLEEDHTFKSLFLHNLHVSVQYDVTMHCIMENLSMQEIRRYAQVVWETHVHSNRAGKGKVRVLNIQTDNRPKKKCKVSPQVMQQN
ncbi:hypothetical protein CHARACLAT_026818 [Characodon lateralis]|uniref:Uncharacterized protein n=1 Tax=Characodon lateralis TaxID=208331 RepID=A0ABU7DLV8_9TELE|nr:hypothetical protein [Characodon lateralis]